MNMNSLSIVISTYNSPKYLELVLNGIINQHDQNFECIIADDGSGEETENLVKKFSKKRKFIHAWHEDKGFRLAAIRNRAIAIASGASIAFIDGDCIPAPEYSEDAKRLMQRSAKLNLNLYFQGHRVILDEYISTRISQSKNIFGFGWKFSNMHHLSNLTNSFRYPYPIVPTVKTKGIRGCNMLFKREHLVAVNGFDEEFVGWGHEDRDIVERLFKIGVRRADARGSMTVYHLYHPEHDRSASEKNLKLSLSERPIKAKQGLVKCS